MPEMRGDEFLNISNTTKLFKQIPVVMLSERGQHLGTHPPAGRGRGRDYIVKPFNLLELKIRIKRFSIKIPPSSKSKAGSQYGPASKSVEGRMSPTGHRLGDAHADVAQDGSCRSSSTNSATRPPTSDIRLLNSWPGGVIVLITSRN